MYEKGKILITGNKFYLSPKTRVSFLQKRNLMKKENIIYDK